MEGHNCFDSKELKKVSRLKDGYPYASDALRLMLGGIGTNLQLYRAAKAARRKERETRRQSAQQIPDVSDLPYRRFLLLGSSTLGCAVLAT